MPVVAYDELHVLLCHPNRTECIAFFSCCRRRLFFFAAAGFIVCRGWYVLVRSTHSTFYYIWLFRLQVYHFCFYYFTNSTHNYTQRKCQRCTKQKYKNKRNWLGSARACSAKQRTHETNNGRTAEQKLKEAKLHSAISLCFVSMMRWPIQLRMVIRFVRITALRSQPCDGKPPLSEVGSSRLAKTEETMIRVACTCEWKRRSDDANEPNGIHSSKSWFTNTNFDNSGQCHSNYHIIIVLSSIVFSAARRMHLQFARHSSSSLLSIRFHFVLSILRCCCWWMWAMVLIRMSFEHGRVGIDSVNNIQ